MLGRYSRSDDVFRFEISNFDRFGLVDLGRFVNPGLIPGAIIVVDIRHVGIADIAAIDVVDDGPGEEHTIREELVDCGASYTWG